MPESKMASGNKIPAPISAAVLTKYIINPFRDIIKKYTLFPYIFFKAFPFGEGGNRRLTDEVWHPIKHLDLTNMSIFFSNTTSSPAFGGSFPKGEAFKNLC